MKYTERRVIQIKFKKWDGMVVVNSEMWEVSYVFSSDIKVGKTNFIQLIKFIEVSKF